MIGLHQVIIPQQLLQSWKLYETLLMHFRQN